MRGVRFDEIRQKLIGRIDQLVRELVPGGRFSGNYYIAKNPTRNDHHAGSFWVLVKGAAAGAWRDEAGLRGVDDGDVIRLVAYCLGHKDLAETRRWCLRWLGLGDGKAAGGISPEQQAARDRRFAEQRAREEQIEVARRAKNAQNAFALWLKAEPLTAKNFEGSLADRYLKGRKLDLVAKLLAKGRPLPGAIRLFARGGHNYITDQGEVIEAPCMIALMTGPNGAPRAVHRTWLADDGSAKAIFPDPHNNPARKIWPAGWAGSVIRIARGAGQLTPEEAERQGRRAPLVIAEGVEDALTISLALPDFRVWAAGTLGNLGKVPVLPCVKAIIVAADNDWGKPQAQAQLEQNLVLLRKSGVPVSVARSPQGKDFNDLVMARQASTEGEET